MATNPGQKEHTVFVLNILREQRHCYSMMMNYQMMKKLTTLFIYCINTLPRASALRLHCTLSIIGGKPELKLNG